METIAAQESGIDFAAIEKRIASGERLSVKKLSQELNTAQSKIRTVLLTHYGTRIKFQRGRTGGIKIS
jgi:hypothetical protein